MERERGGRVSRCPPVSGHSIRSVNWLPKISIGPSCPAELFTSQYWTDWELSVEALQELWLLEVVALVVFWSDLTNLLPSFVLSRVTRAALDWSWYHITYSPPAVSLTGLTGLLGLTEVNTASAASLSHSYCPLSLSLSLSLSLWPRLRTAEAVRAAVVADYGWCNRAILQDRVDQQQHHCHCHYLSLSHCTVLLLPTTIYMINICHCREVGTTGPKARPREHQQPTLL